METKFHFKSQICTSREQSERLLALGLRKETADMCLSKVDAFCQTFDLMSPHKWTEEQSVSDTWYPAWSLGRLWELYWSNKVVSDCLFGCGKYMNPYAKMIAMIEYDIEDGTFNNDYLDK